MLKYNFAKAQSLAIFSLNILTIKDNNIAFKCWLYRTHNIKQLVL